jgi:hypothetical protein
MGYLLGGERLQKFLKLLKSGRPKLHGKLGSYLISVPKPQGGFVA